MLNISIQQEEVMLAMTAMTKQHHQQVIYYSGKFYEVELNLPLLRISSFLQITE